MFRNGWDNNIKSADAIPVLENASKARMPQGRRPATVTVRLAPLRKEDAPNKELEEAWGYYHTARCQYPATPGFATARSLNQIITYDAYDMEEVFLTQPLQIVAGRELRARQSGSASGIRGGGVWASREVYALPTGRGASWHRYDKETEE